MEQEIIFTENAAGSLGDILIQRGIKNPFVIMGRHFELQNEKQKLLSFPYNSYTKENTEVTAEEILTCSGKLIASEQAAVIAIGGGRVIDLAKAVIHRQYKDNLAQLPLFICVPTTAGSGSEATQFAVVYQDKIKSSVDETFLLPRIAILDPLLTYSLPGLQTAVSGIDALAQAIESYWNIHATTASSEFAAGAASILLANLPLAVSSPNSVSRKNLLWAAHLSGKAINITRTTGPHALSYFLTAHYNISHGQAVAFFLPLFFLYNANVDSVNCNHPGGPGKVTQRLDDLYTMLNVKNAAEAADYLRDFMRRTGLATTLAEVGIDKIEIMDTLLGAVNKQRFNNNPVSLNVIALKKICMDYL